VGGGDPDPAPLRHLTIIIIIIIISIITIITIIITIIITVFFCNAAEMKAPKQNAGSAVDHQLIDEDALEYEQSDFDKILTAVQ
jgi:hypothetical protein